MNEISITCKNKCSVCWTDRKSIPGRDRNPCICHNLQTDRRSHTVHIHSVPQYLSSNLKPVIWYESIIFPVRAATKINKRILVLLTQKPNENESFLRRQKFTGILEIPCIL